MIEVLEDEKNKLKLEFKGESQALTQLLATQAWKEKGEAAAIREHPFLEEPKLIVLGRSPKRILKRASKAIEEQCDEFKEEFRRALGK